MAFMTKKQIAAHSQIKAATVEFNGLPYYYR
jgi:hypothetical protein